MGRRIEKSLEWSRRKDWFREEKVFCHSSNYAEALQLRGEALKRRLIFVEGI